MEMKWNGMKYKMERSKGNEIKKTRIIERIMMSWESARRYDEGNRFKVTDSEVVLRKFLLS